MSLLPLRTQVNASQALYAPTGPGGGGGVGPSLTVSTLFAADTVSTLCVNLENINAAGQYPGRLRANSGTMLLENQNGEPWALALSTITVSTINNTPPVFTDGSVYNIATLFKDLFTANPSLSSILF